MGTGFWGRGEGRENEIMTGISCARFHEYLLHALVINHLSYSFCLPHDQGAAKVVPRIRE